MFRPEGKQPNLGIIFRGEGKRISQDEMLAWHPRVDVFFQKNAWMDGNVCQKWVEKTLAKFVEEENLERFVLLLDNLSSHSNEEFKKSVSDISGVIWYGLPDATDLWQPVDAGYAQVLKALISKEQQSWLDTESNSDRWFGNENPYSAKERRILITNWAGEAWKKLSDDEKYVDFRRRLWEKTGCLITADGTNDDLIKPEGLPDYVVPPPSIVDPIRSAPTTNESGEVIEESQEYVEVAEEDIELDERVENLDGGVENAFDIFHLFI